MVERLTPERRRAQTKAHLLAAAAEVFARRGYRAATLDEIAEAAGFSKGAVYSNFASKADLFLELSRAREAELVGAFEAAATEGGVESLRAVYAGADADARSDAWALSAEFTLFALRDPSAREQLAEASRARHRFVADLVARQCGEDGIEPPLTADLVARIYEALFTGLWQQQVVDPEGVDDDAFAEAALLLRRALSALGRPAR